MWGRQRVSDGSIIGACPTHKLCVGPMYLILVLVLVTWISMIWILGSTGEAKNELKELILGETGLRNWFGEGTSGCMVEVALQELIENQLTMLDNDPHHGSDDSDEDNNVGRGDKGHVTQPVNHWFEDLDLLHRSTSSGNIPKRRKKRIGTGTAKTAKGNKTTRFNGALPSSRNILHGRISKTTEESVRSSWRFEAPITPETFSTRVMKKTWLEPFN